ncbi:DUF3073 domain-containing protein [Nocardia huaxiensis]|uniref:DUF3073 domain-containing protein n=1 Tax=Nocardia huaxiensis TaxID=2755382 RepID=A0A7D6VJT0_9NOCA|nr:DUF3073 domain-containing protein [Nocardia huaxiensis]QLY31596.1 DUF3073 domain-containing protein [Nocardia huaxiensis]UFS95149.1 DUF3073 domain-containing protein [Nocardia huaxiensis]
MGRGRAKAKQTKVARELKYSSPSTDFASLQRELSGSSTDSPLGGVKVSDERDADDSLSSWNNDDDYDDWRR